MTAAIVSGLGGLAALAGAIFLGWRWRAALARAARLEKEVVTLEDFLNRARDDAARLRKSAALTREALRAAEDDAIDSGANPGRLLERVLDRARGRTAAGGVRSDEAPDATQD